VQALVLAIGNTLRGDDGAAHHVADLLGARAGVDVRRVHQLTPELAPEVAGAQTVVFVDADTAGTETRMERVTAAPRCSSLSHGMAPDELIRLAEQLYGFRGVAYLCHVPARDFTPHGALSEATEAGVHEAAKLVTVLVVEG
jgi:hydrogenase maturation protease